ncbi:MAG: hypothetical protein A3F41_02305 [Coxiella sp. RIFCSPHIGHO2_12_FULL_44_14]|nr:MAG: hypothetical protein A3F41_02305 [Coxiella sp. RIFCSPHIGHO2_12_FULL_44_14]
MEAQLHCLLPPANTVPTTLHQAMRYAVLNGGKRLRPLLVYATGLSLSAPLTALDYPAAAIEFMHGYSLVHDDLPSMDNDDFRRNRLSCHKMYGEATAILVGDALQSLALQCLTYPTPSLTANQQLQMVATLTQAAGSCGMAGGQHWDLNMETSITLDTLEHIYALKTGALIRASVQLGTIAAPIPIADSDDWLDAFANRLGLAFQIHDDLLDRTSESTRSMAKITYVTLCGVERTRQRLRDLTAEMLAILEKWPGDTAHLQQMLTVFFITDKKN